MKNLVLLVFIALLNNSFGQLAQWTHSDGKGWFIETVRKAANNKPIWQESGQFNYEELSRTESEVLLKDINGRSDMQVKITNNACFWKYPNDVNWNTLQSGSWTVKPILRIEENCTSSRSNYLEQNPDVKKAGLDPWGHYQSFGKKEGRKWPNCNVDFYEVTIGSQIWMNKNLNADKFRNGDPIPEAKTNEEWQRANSNQQPAWCYYNNDPKNGEKYGKLYNWYAVNDPRGLAPLGWKVAFDEDWKNLIANYSGNANAGSKLKSSNGAAFQGELGGFRNGTGPFVDLGIFGDFWTSLSTDSYNAVYYKIGANSNAIDRSTNDKPGGLSVRCVKEMNSVSTNNVSSSNNVSQTVISTNSAPQTTNLTINGSPSAEHPLNKMKCEACLGSGKCNECNKLFKVAVYENAFKNYMDTEEKINLGFVSCKKCFGSGYLLRCENPNTAFDACPCESCNGGWLKCNNCLETNKGYCRICNGSGKSH